MNFIDYKKLGRKGFYKLMKDNEIIIFHFFRHSICNMTDVLYHRAHEEFFIKKKNCRFEYTFEKFRGKPLQRRDIQNLGCFSFSKRNINTFKKFKGLFLGHKVSVKGMSREAFQKEFFVDLLRL